jgi:MazG family protein
VSATADALSELVAVVARLRRECPWDREQTHLSLRRYLLEETYEVLEALDRGDSQRLRDELGDLLLQVLMHAAIAEEEGRFDVQEVARAETEKMVRRHPHVFAGAPVSGAQEVLQNWETLKAREQEGGHSILDGVPPLLPALARAQAVQQRAARAGFQVPEREGALPEAGGEAEFGDLLFALVALGHRLGVQAEDALRAATLRFEARVRASEGNPAK